jgi:hypothetical protein
MSLLITSSKQKEFDGVATHSIGIERPYSYINTMRSPLIIDADSEIAVVSVKCERNGKLEVDSRGFRVGLYWGNELTAGNTLTSARSTNRVVYASVRGGTYTPGELAEELQIALNTVAVNTFSNMNSVVVTTQQDTNGDFSGFEFTFSQNASSTDVKASLTTIATVNNNNKNPPGRLAEHMELVLKILQMLLLTHKGHKRSLLEQDLIRLHLHLIHYHQQVEFVKLILKVVLKILKSD